MKARITLPPVHRERLDNGLTLILASRPGVPLAAARIVFRGGSSVEPADRCGLGHLAAISTRRGAGRRTGEQIDLLVESLGADVGAGVDEDATYVGLSAPVEALPRCLEVLGDVAMAPTFPAPEVARLRRREVASLVHDLDEPAVVADRAMLQAAYGDHPYGHPPEGRARDLLRVSRPEIRAFHQRQWRPEEAILLVVGAVPAEAVLPLARRRFGRWRGPAGPAPEVPPPAPPRPAVVVVDRPDLTQTQVRIVSGGYGRRSPDYFAGMVTSAVLGGGFTSRLMQEIRVNRGLSYGVRSRFATSAAGGLFYVSSFTKVESTAELVAVALEHRTASLVGARSGRRVGIVSGRPGATVRVPTGSAAPLSSVTVVVRWPIEIVNVRPCQLTWCSTIAPIPPDSDGSSCSASALQRMPE